MSQQQETIELIIEDQSDRYPEYRVQDYNLSSHPRGTKEVVFTWVSTDKRRSVKRFYVGPRGGIRDIEFY